MRFSIFLALICVAPVGAQTQGARPAAEAAEADPAKKAAQYLEMAAAMVGAMTPESQAGALLQLALVEAPVDKGKALEHFEQAFTAAAALPNTTAGRVRDQVQARAVAGVAPLSIDRAIELAASLNAPRPLEQDVRADAIYSVVQHLVKEKKFDKAVEAMDRFNAAGAYPLRAAGHLLSQLPADDSRRGALFSMAVAGFSQNPDCHNMISFLRQFQEMPMALRETAIRALMRAIEENKGMPFFDKQTVTSNGGSVSLESAQDIMIFNAVDMIRPVDPDWLRKMAAERPSLRAGLERFPGGVPEMRAAGNLVISLATGAAPSLGADSMAFQRAMEFAEKDPSRALALSREIPMPRMQAILVSEVARATKSKNAAESSATLSACVARLDEVKPLNVRQEGWDAIAEAAGASKNSDLVLKAVERGMADAAAIFKYESRAEDPNLAPRSAWMSSQNYKRLFYRAAKALGPASESLLEKINDPELQVLARVEMAAAWLGQGPTPTITHFARKPQR